MLKRYSLGPTLTKFAKLSICETANLLQLEQQQVIPSTLLKVRVMRLVLFILVILWEGAMAISSTYLSFIEL